MTETVMRVEPAPVLRERILDSRLAGSTLTRQRVNASTRQHGSPSRQIPDRPDDVLTKGV
ncbi:MAG TPA: hypothetical protein VNF05_05175 [Acidimicrobiales bacterium]|nr:hypothetical protein [Acidimicrobiales bacterium]